MDLSELLEKYKDSETIPYSEYLKTDEWKEKRIEILKRDKFICTNCGKGETTEIFDKKTGKNLHFWFGEDEWVDDGNGLKVLLPKPILADKPYHLEVHHCYYIENKLPWSYDNSDLITLCNWCHWDYHQNNEIQVYSEDKINEMKYTACKRCNGAGWFPEYKKIEGGVCFRCRGAKYDEILIKHKKNG